MANPPTQGSVTVNVGDLSNALTKAPARVEGEISDVANCNPMCIMAVLISPSTPAGTLVCATCTLRNRHLWDSMQTRCSVS